MDTETVVIFFVLVGLIYYFLQLNRHNKVVIPVKDESGHVKPEHLLYDVLKQYSSGDKVYLSGQCEVNLYSKHIIDVNMKQKFTKLLNEVFSSVYGITNRLFQVQELNNVYEQIDSSNNKRYVVDATLNSLSNYYTARVMLDIVVINNEVMVNYINVNDASNNNIIDRYDVVYDDQGILFNHNNTENEEKFNQQELTEIKNAMVEQLNEFLKNLPSFRF